MNYKTKVRAGEASESGEESSSNVGLSTSNVLFPNKVKIESKLEHAVVVLGEASESEEEEIMTDSAAELKTPNSKLSLTIRSQHDGQAASDTRKTPVQAVYYKSLLHKKLRERNASLSKRISQAAHHPYEMATKELNAISQQLAKSQSQIQEVGPVLRILTNDLCHLEDKLDITLACSSLIPAINIDNSTTKHGSAL